MFAKYDDWVKGPFKEWLEDLTLALPVPIALIIAILSLLVLVLVGVPIMIIDTVSRPKKAVKYFQDTDWRAFLGISAWAILGAVFMLLATAVAHTNLPQTTISPLGEAILLVCGFVLLKLPEKKRGLSNDWVRTLSLISGYLTLSLLIAIGGLRETSEKLAIPGTPSFWTGILFLVTLASTIVNARRIESDRLVFKSGFPAFIWLGTIIIALASIYRYL